MLVYCKLNTHCEKNVIKLKGLKWTDFNHYQVIAVLFERV